MPQIKNILLLGWCTLLLTVPKQLLAQNASFFKVWPTIEDSDPEWVKEMYNPIPNVFKVTDLYEDYYNEHPYEKNIHTQNFKHWLIEVKHLADKDGFVYPNANKKYSKRLNEIKALRSKKKSLDDNRKRVKSTKVSTTLWSNVGPRRSYTNQDGKTLSIAQANVYTISVAPSNSNYLYVGTQTGGLFRSKDKGQHWTLIAKEEAFNPKIIDVTIHPTDTETIYFSSADNNIYKSIDGGKTTTSILDAEATIEQLLIHPVTPTIVFAATAKGLFQTKDGGSNWIKIRNDRCWDIITHATNPDILYLSVSSSTLKSSLVYKSTDTGETWTLKNNNWYQPTKFDEAKDLGCKLATTPADPNRVYAALIGDSKKEDKSWIGVYYSLDNGDSWVNADGIDGGPYVTGHVSSTNWFCAGYYSSGTTQGWYNFDLAVSHQDPDKIWVGSIWYLESSNRGKHMEHLRKTRNLSIHADIQDIEIVGNDIWIASDGGVNYSDDECKTVKILNEGLSASTFWEFTQGWNEDTWTGGRYHNGNAYYHENFGKGSTVFLGGGEAPTGYLNPQQSIGYYSDMKDKKLSNDLSKKSQDKKENSSLYPNASFWSFNSSEIEYHPSYSSILYLGNKNIFYMSEDNGINYKPLFTFEDKTWVHNFDISRKNPDVIYCQVRESFYQNGLYKSTDGGHNFSKLTIPFKSRNMAFSMDTEQTDHLWIVNASSSSGARVYETTDGGLSWIDRTTSALGSEKILGITYQLGSENQVYIFTNTAIFYWDNTLKTWNAYDNGLPFIHGSIRMLPFYRDEKLRLAGGRGVWEAPLKNASRPLAQPITYNKKIECTGDTIHFDDYSVLKHQGAKWQWEFPGASYVSSPTIRNPKVVYNQNGSFDVKLSITNAKGQTSSKTIANMITIKRNCNEIIKYPEKAWHAFKGHHFYMKNESFTISPTNNFSVSFWVKPYVQDYNYSGVITLLQDDGKYFFLSVDTDFRLRFKWDKTGEIGYNTGLFLDPEKWNYVVAVIEPDATTIYVNEKVYRTSQTNSSVQFNTILVGMGPKERFYRAYKGYIEELMIWDTSLTEEQVRLNRHLIPLDAPTRNEIVSYYQFNFFQNGDYVHDLKGPNHLKASYDFLDVNRVKGVVELNESSAPVGEGVSEKVSVISSVSSSTSVGLSITFKSTSAPKGDLYFSRIKSFPDSLPTKKYFEKQYWVVNNYSSSSTIEGVESLSFSGLVSPTQITDPKKLRLMQRAANDDYDTWISTVASPSTNELSTFNNGDLTFVRPEFTSLGQFYFWNNSPPITQAVSGTTRAGTPVQLTLKATDIDGDPFVFSVSPSGQGSATLTGSNTITYKPNFEFTGTDSFTFSVSDGITSSSNSATVVVENYKIIHSKKSGSWDDCSTWLENVIPDNGDIVIIKSGHSINLPEGVFEALEVHFEADSSKLIFQNDKCILYLTKKDLGFIPTTCK